LSEGSVASRRRLLGIPSFSGISGGGKKTIDWEEIIPYLGTTTDKMLADKYNVSVTSIYVKRIKMGIKAYAQPVDWEKITHLFNIIPDIELAKMHNVSTGAVLSARKRLGIAAPKKDLSFIDQYLDNLSDTEIAKIFGLKKISVYHRRFLVNKKKR
jgi:hypothetical protein